MNWYSKDLMQTSKLLGTSLEYGLSAEEAKRRFIQNGANALEKKKRTSLFLRFIMQFKDNMVLLLIAAAVISLITAVWGGGDMSEPIMIIAIVVFNAIVGLVQECKAENALLALQKENPRTARVVRNGIITEIPAEEIVIGDIIHISQGDIAPADCRICECMDLTVSESNLTGESAPILKNTKTLGDDTPLAERSDMLYMGTKILTGSAVCAAVETGIRTELGKIADSLSQLSEEETPLQKKLAKTGKVLGVAALAICFVIFVIGVLQKRPPLEMLMTAVSLAVAAIPEGLPAVVTVMLAIGVRKMAAENAVVRRLSAVETLGGATVICTDKTGTLTENKMSVECITGNDKDKVIKMAALCTSIERGENGWLGDPTEVAIVECAGFNEDPEMPCCGEISFTSERRMMTRIFCSGGKYFAVSKGAAEVVIEKCCYENDISNKLAADRRKELISLSESLENDGLRVLAVAERPLESFSEAKKTVEKDLCFLGFIGLMDKPRSEAEKAVHICKRAGIRPIMITGDSPLTAKNIGKRVGICTKDPITGAMLDKMSDEELKKALDEGSDIFARTSPEHKLRIVRVLKEMGHVSAMTGDACNDAPALKAADIGCAMGLCGTETAREAADIVLTDDNFATVVKAVKYGRGIFDNIKRSVHFLLSSNIGEIITVFSSMFFGFAVPLAPVQLLWINLVTDSLPAIALGLEPEEADIMKRPPYTSQSIFGKDTWARLAAEGVMIGFLALVAGGIGKVFFASADAARTMTFAVLSISQLVHAFNMRSEGSLFRLDPFSNPWLVGAFVIGCIMQAAVIALPVLNGIFAVTGLNILQWSCVFILSLLPIAVVEAEKAFGR